MYIYIYIYIYILKINTRMLTVISLLLFVSFSLLFSFSFTFPLRIYLPEEKCGRMPISLINLSSIGFNLSCTAATISLVGSAGQFDKIICRWRTGPELLLCDGARSAEIGTVTSPSCLRRSCRLFRDPFWVQAGRVADARPHGRGGFPVADVAVKTKQ